MIAEDLLNLSGTMEAVAQEDFETLLDLTKARVRAHRFSGLGPIQAVERSGNFEDAGANQQKRLLEDFRGSLDGGDQGVSLAGARKAGVTTAVSGC